MVRNEQRIREDEVFIVGVNTMNEVSEMLKRKLNEMRSKGETTIMFSFEEVSKLYQFVCFMKQVRELVNWSEEK